MTPIEAVRGARQGMIAVFLLVLTVGAMAGVVSGRGATPAEPPRGATWQRLLDTGHLARARGDAPSARRAYLTALFRARGERSVLGVLSAAEGFRALGDSEVVERALAMAATLGPRDDAGVLRTRLPSPGERLSATDAPPTEVHVGR